MECLGSEGDILKFDKAHRPILLGAETQSLVSSLLGEHGFQFLFRGIDGQVSDVKCVAGRVLIGGIHRWNLSLISLHAERKRKS